MSLTAATSKSSCLIPTFDAIFHHPRHSDVARPCVYVQRAMICSLQTLTHTSVESHQLNKTGLLTPHLYLTVLESLQLSRANATTGLTCKQMFRAELNYVESTVFFFRMMALSPPPPLPRSPHWSSKRDHPRPSHSPAGHWPILHYRHS